MPIEDDVELDEDQKEPPKKRSVKKVIIFTVLGLLIIGGGTAAGLYFTGHLPMSAQDSAEEDGAGDTTDDGKKKGKKGKKTKEGKNSKNSKKEEVKPAIYLALDPPFVVNFQDQTHARFLQVTIEVMARDQLVIDAVKIHMPLIRNNLLLLLSSQTYETVTTREGKEKIRATSLEEIQKVMKEETGDPGVEGVYFTSFVMQ